jgi:hypothetical protein
MHVIEWRLGWGYSGRVGVVSVGAPFLCARGGVGVRGVREGAAL